MRAIEARWKHTVSGIKTSAFLDIVEGGKSDRGIIEAESDGSQYVNTTWYCKSGKSERGMMEAQSGGNLHTHTP